MVIPIFLPVDPGLAICFLQIHGTITCTKKVYCLEFMPTTPRHFENLPVWVDVDCKHFYYGIPGNAHRGFKIGVDIRGQKFDPTAIQRKHLQGSRIYRTPVSCLPNAPLAESRVRPYQNSGDANFIFDLIPGTLMHSPWEVDRVMDSNTGRLGSP